MKDRLTEKKLKIGVWVQGGKVYRRDFEKQPYPRVYTPKIPENLEAVKMIARQLHSDVTMESWTAEIEAWHDELQEKLKKLIETTK